MMKNYLVKIVLITFIAVTSNARLIAQPEPLSSQYFDLQSIYNPAATGAQNELKAAFNMRLDSIGKSERPKYFTGIIDVPYQVGDVLLGGGIIGESSKGEPNETFTIGLQLKAGIKAGPGYLSFGLRPAILRGFTSINPVDIPNEEFNPSITPEDSKRLKGTTFDLGAGIYYSTNKFRISLSSLHLNSPKIKFKSKQPVNAENEYETAEYYNLKIPVSIYFMTGGNISLKKSLLEMMPSILLAHRDSKMTYLATAMFRYKQLIQLGLGIRENVGSIIAGVEYKGFHLTYSYDMGLKKDISGKKTSAHEITVWYSASINFKKENKNKQKSIRFL